MCGIVALITNKKNGFDNEAMGIMGHSMFLNQLRGDDSTGMISINNKNIVDTLKVVGGPEAFYASPKWEAFKQNLWKEGKVMVGHGRSATKGTVIEANAHPFVVEKPNKKNHIFLVHNGTLTAYQQLPGFDNHNVDSAWLAHCIAEHGPEETFGRLNGAAACIWYDSEQERLYLYRNKERPLHVMVTTNGTMIMASESSPLYYLKDKYSLKSDEGVLQWTANTLCWINSKDFGDIKSANDVESKEITRLYAKAVTYPSHYSGNSDGFTFPGESYEDDVKGLQSGKITGIKWSNGFKTKAMTYGESTWDATIQQKPIEKDLVEMMLDPNDPTILRKHYDTGSSKYMVQVHLDTKPDDKIVPIDTKRKVRTRLDYKLSDTKFQLKRGVKFSTIHAGNPVKHRAISGDIVPDSFIKYQNEIDGKFKIGDVINMEVYDTNYKTGLVSGFIVSDSGKQSLCIDVYFHNKNIPLEVIDEMDSYQGKIHSIDLVSDAVHQLTGSVVKIQLDEVVPLAVNGSLLRRGNAS